jgi:ABC-2 type transport system permease protein
MQHIIAVVYRDALIRLTSLTWFFFDLTVPLLYLLMFGVGFDKAIGMGVISSGAAVGYSEFFLAGVLSMSCFGSAINQSYGFFHDRETGIFYEFLTYPMTRGEYLFGKVIFQCLMSIVQASLTLIAAITLLQIPVRIGFLPVTILVVALGIAGWFFALSMFAFRIHRNDTFNTFINGLYFVLMFVSSMFYPLDSMPVWLRYAAYLNPLTWHTDVLRFCTIGVGDASVIFFEVLGFVLFSVTAFVLSVRTLKMAI